MNKVLDTIQARADAATEGPWAVEVDEDGFDGASVYLKDGGYGTAYISQNMWQGPTEGEADAEFIAHAREDVPKLVAALRAVEVLAEQWRYKGEFGWGAWQEGHGPSPEGSAYDDAAAAAAAAIRGAISGVLDG